MTAETLKSQDFAVLLSNAFGKDKVSDTRKVFEFILNPKSLRREVVDEVKDEVASRDFVRAEIADAKLELKQDIAEVKSELKQDIAEVKLELKQDIAEVKAELKQDIADVRQEIADTKLELKQDIAGLRVEFKTDSASLKTELKQDIADVRKEIKSITRSVIYSSAAIVVAIAGACISALWYLSPLIEQVKAMVEAAS